MVLSRIRDKTNNTAERALRHAVIMRKVQFGTQSENGNRWIERILSVRETCRLQERSAVAYLVEAASAAHHGRPGAIARSTVDCRHVLKLAATP